MATSTPARVTRSGGAYSYDARAVAAVHAKIEKRTATFARATGLKCPPGCGQCCLSPDVETTVADVLPMAEQIVARGRADEILARLEAAPDTRCILYDADPENPTRGQCSMYDVRPSICRLFGFAGRRDPDGNPELSACWIHGVTIPDVVAEARAAVAERRIALPMFADLAGQAATAAPEHSGRLQPINDALLQAIQRVGLESTLRSMADADGNGDDNDHDLTPPTPRIPPRRAA